MPPNAAWPGSAIAPPLSESGRPHGSRLAAGEMTDSTMCGCLPGPPDHGLLHTSRGHRHRAHRRAANPPTRYGITCRSAAAVRRSQASLPDATSRSARFALQVVVPMPEINNSRSEPAPATSDNGCRSCPSHSRARSGSSAWDGLRRSIGVKNNRYSMEARIQASCPDAQLKDSWIH